MNAPAAMPVHVINLDRAPERWSFMQAQGARRGLDLQRVAAVDGSAIAEAELARLCARDARGRRLIGAELGCYRSHMLAWARIAGGDAAFGAVLEDDVWLASDAAAFLGHAGWIPGDAEVITLSANGVRVTRAEVAELTHVGRGLHRLVSRTVDAGGYILARTAARRLLAAEPRFHLAVDLVLLDPAGGRVIYQVVPGLCVQQKHASFAFLAPGAGASAIQDAKPRRGHSPASTAKLGREAHNLWSKQLLPPLLPALQLFTPRAARIVKARVPFADAAPGYGGTQLPLAG